MPITLVFPDGVKLAQEHEIPGPAPQRAAEWARIQSANIAQGFMFERSNIPLLRGFASALINVNAPLIWSVFTELCNALLGPMATLEAASNKGGLREWGPASVVQLLAMLERHKYRLAHDGFVGFGLKCEGRGRKNGNVFVTHLKYFLVSLYDEQRFRAVMEKYGIPQAYELEFIDDYPNVRTRLKNDFSPFHEVDDLLNHFANEISAPSRR